MDARYDGKINRLDVDSKKSSVINFHVKTTKKIQQALQFKQDLPQDNFTAKMLRDVEISPNGEKVVFESMGHIYTRNIVDGKAKGKAKRLTKQNSHFELNPSFSRDGKNIVYATWHDQEQGQIRIVSSRGGKGKTLLKEQGKYIEPTFSPDGKTVVYRKISGGYITKPSWDLNTGIYAVSAKGERKASKPILITEHGQQPHFGNNNDNIYVVREGDKPQLAFVSLDGKDDRALYQSKFATEYRVSFC